MILQQKCNENEKERDCHWSKIYVILSVWVLLYLECNCVCNHIIIIIIIIIVIIIIPLEFLTSVLADGFSVEFEWQQVSSSLQDSSQYSGRPEQCCRLDSLYSSANFQVLQAL